eukprot:TRINITY_DN67564_c5_g1_i1.p1 TRINITY_DN67564_c5_g1~~TRINITY_DN67564_c5_g1_i1.p1  ORF type:complete len:164 (+),score=13.49 TRINITY_DN67564_c5_g1_i1:62-553(+)
MAELTFRAPTEADTKTISELEAKSYPEDEAATFDQFTYRIGKANDYFLVMESESQIVGFVCGTRSVSKTLDHDSMSAHTSDGLNLCIHSVVIAPEYRRRGWATTMLKEYIQRMKQDKSIQVLSLISKEYLLGLYGGVGFKDLGVSSISHGKDQWHEMQLETGN